MPDPSSPSNLLYYSANSYLSYHINRRFYKGRHYVWVSPVFNPSTLDDMHEWRNIPVSSAPHDVYLNYRDSVNSLDDHSDIIERNKRGLKRGAIKLLADDVIDETQFQFINHMIDNAKINQFRPLLYLIPSHLVHSRIDIVPPSELANPLSMELRVLDLKDGEFDVLEFKR
jgi:hypothetical protein